MPRFLHGLAVLPLLLASGCATVHGEPEPHDPYEGFNRSMYRFNDTVDRAVLKPVAEFYDDAVPAPINTGVSNFFSNLDDVTVLINDLLQAKFRQAGSDFARISFNTTFGLFGLFDVASHMDLPKHNEDFGQTLGYWGVGSGPYLVLPFLGPSTVRDGTGTVASWYTEPLTSIEDPNTYWGAVALRAVDTRAELLRASRLLEQAALDPYVFTREAYLQLRRSRVYDGQPPQEELDIFEEEFDPTAPAPEGPAENQTTPTP
jgi:phospholipid-binding lipoprotein MlaA